jgi:hypothetical protein
MTYVYDAETATKRTDANTVRHIRRQKRRFLHGRLCAMRTLAYDILAEMESAGLDSL